MAIVGMTTPSAAGRALQRLRKTRKARPVVLHPCKHCGDGFPARAIRKHQARCNKNPAICPRIQAELHKGAL